MKITAHALGLLLCATTATANPSYEVGVIQIVEHPALDAAREGLQESLKEAGMAQDVRLEYLNAQGNMIVGGQIAKQLLGKKPHAIVAIATPVAQAVVNGNKTVPVVFTAVTDPVSAGLAESLQKPGGISTGASDLTPMKEQLAMMREVVPGLKRLAIFYNPGEANSMVILKNFKDECARQGITPVEAVVMNTASVMPTAKSMVGKVDAFYVPTDNTVVSAFESVLKVSTQTKTPLFTADSGTVKQGAFAAVSVDYHKLGKLTGTMLIDVLKGKKPGEMPVGFLENNLLYVNTRHAKAMGITVPASILKRAHQVFE